MYFWDGTAQGVSSPSHKTIDMNTGLLSYYQSKVWEKKKVSLRWNHFEERQIPEQIHHFISTAKKNISIRKTHWLVQGLRKVTFRWNQVSFKLAAYFLCLETPGLPACYPLNSLSGCQESVWPPVLHVSFSIDPHNPFHACSWLLNTPHPSPLI